MRTKTFEPLAASQYEDAAAAVIEPSPEPAYSERLRAGAALLERTHARHANIEIPILDCAGPSPTLEHRDTLRAILAVLR